MADLKADYEGALEARLQAAAAAKDAAYALQQRAEAAEALLVQLRHENDGLAGPLTLVTLLACLRSPWCHRPGSSLPHHGLSIQ